MDVEVPEIRMERIRWSPVIDGDVPGTDVLVPGPKARGCNAAILKRGEIPMMTMNVEDRTHG